jgi:plasmid partitioning protein RepB
VTSKDPSKSGFMGSMKLDIGQDGKDLSPGKKKYEKPAEPKPERKREPAKPKPDKADPLKLVSIDPDKVLPWEFANRPDSEFGDMDELITSIAESGQEVPALVRQKGNHFELIYGRRRWRAAKHLNIDLLCRVRNLSDREAFISQANENENRKDLSAWARAKDYKRALDKKIFPTVNALAASLGLDRGSVHNLLILNKIPEDIVEVIGDMTNMGIQAAKTIHRLVNEEEGEQHTQTLIKNADKLRAGLGPKSIERLCFKVETKPQSSRVVSGKGGDLFSISNTSRGALNITILKGGKNLLTEEQIMRALKEVFEREAAGKL